MKRMEASGGYDADSRHAENPVSEHRLRSIVEKAKADAQTFLKQEALESGHTAMGRRLVFSDLEKSPAIYYADRFHDTVIGNLTEEEVDAYKAIFNSELEAGYPRRRDS